MTNSMLSLYCSLEHLFKRNLLLFHSILHGEYMHLLLIYMSYSVHHVNAWMSEWHLHLCMIWLYMIRHCGKLGLSVSKNVRMLTKDSVRVSYKSHLHALQCTLLKFCFNSDDSDWVSGCVVYLIPRNFINLDIITHNTLLRYESSHFCCMLSPHSAISLVSYILMPS